MKINSVVDIITNSSSELFTLVDSSLIYNAKPFFNKVLKHLGVKGDFDDYFIIQKCLRQNYIDACFEDWAVNHELKKLWCEFLEKSQGQDTPKNREKFSIFVNDLYRIDQLPDHSIDSEDSHLYDSVEFKMKNSDINILEFFMNHINAIEIDI